MNDKTAAEMPGCGWRGKTKTRFPSAADEPLEIAPAISTFPQPRPRPPWESGNPKAGFPLSHSDFPVPIKSIKNERRSTPAQNLVLQAHLRIGICSRCAPDLNPPPNAG